MPTLEHAIALAVDRHRGQTDRAGQPYILHPLRIMFRLESELERIVGVLHDVVEDTDVSFDDLRAMGYAEDVIAALDGVTKRDNETYEEFVDRSLVNAVSRRVKLADLEDNMDIRRLDDVTPGDTDRLRRYVAAWRKLSASGG